MDFDNKSSNEDIPDPHSFSNLIKTEDVSHILDRQQDLLSRLEKTNAMLQTADELSTHRLESLTNQLRSNTRILVSIKRELSSVLKRTAAIKKNLAKQYPDEFAEASRKIETAWEEELEGGQSEVPISPPSATLQRSMGPLAE